MSRGSFFRIPTDDARVILDRILEAKMDNTLHDETHEAEVDTLPNSLSTLAIPSSEPQKEEIPPPNFMLDIESDLFADFGNSLNYHSIKRTQNDHFSICLPSEYQLRELIAVMSSEWLEESELSSDVIRLDTPSITIRCAYDSDRFNALYNPIVGINIMYESLALKLFKNLVLTPTTKVIKESLGRLVPSLGIINVLPLTVEGSMIHLNFYTFDTWDFDLLIGQPFRRLLYEGHIGKLQISFGKTFKFPITISHSLNNKAESYLLPDPMEEVKAASLELLDEPELEDEAPFFIEEEAEPSEPEPLDEFAETPTPPIELKTLPPGLIYAFLNNNLEFPVIISDKLTQEQTLRLMTILEKHHLVFSYSLHDLIGITLFQQILLFHLLESPNVDLTTQ